MGPAETAAGAVGVSVCTAKDGVAYVVASRFSVETAGSPEGFSGIGFSVRRTAPEGSIGGAFKESEGIGADTVEGVDRRDTLANSAQASAASNSMAERTIPTNTRISWSNRTT